jgi:pimeloyl-ACP methyl ester carboxylesterase
VPDEGTTTQDFDVGEVRLRAIVSGPPDGRLVVLLHGFPECASSWHLVQASLARAGYRVVAPDMRGYGGSDRPAGVAPYAVAHLVADVSGLIGAMGRERAYVVGHDWGAVVAWWTAMLRPDRVERLAIINGPHPVGYANALRTFAQLRRSLYVFFFQLPFLPEAVLAARDYAALRSAFSRDGIADDEIDPCVDALRTRGGVAAAVAYYRAAVRGAAFGGAPAPARITCPVLVLWGEKDRFLVPALAQPPAEWVSDARVVRLPGATHWAPLDAADEVAHNLERFFT